MIEHLVITVLVENTAGGRGLLGEHGIAFLLETEAHRILFDTGQGMALLHNAQQLNLSLTNLDAIVISHGHDDHTGGLPALLQQIPRTDLFLHPAAIAPKYSPRGHIGAPLPDQQTLSRQVRRLVWTETPTEVVPGIWVTGTIPRHHPLEDTGGQFWCDPNRTKIDLILDDQALFVETPQGLVVLFGCAHAGVINTLDYIAQITGTKTFYAVLGGMHLIHANPDRIQATLTYLKQAEVQHIGANHCTGTNALSLLWQELGDRCMECRTGTRFAIGNPERTHTSPQSAVMPSNGIL